MVGLGNGESIFERQVRILASCGITEFVVTTGPQPEQLMAVAAPYVSHGCIFTFVPNPIYRDTNCIYSMYCARQYLRDDDVLVLHGDLVFDVAYAQAVIDSEMPSLGSVNADLPQPEKDFKVRIADGRIREISVNIFGDDCVALQPFYKIAKGDMNTWLDAVELFVGKGDVKVYAEDAANTVFDQMDVRAFSYDGHCVEEVDTPEDLEKVTAAIRLYDFEQQPIFKSKGTEHLILCEGCNAPYHSSITDLASLLDSFAMRYPMVVASERFNRSYVKGALDDAGIQYHLFSGFTPNPTYEEVMVGVATYKAYGCDSLLSFGGGSVIDVAKCVKIFTPMPNGAEERYAAGLYDYSPIPHVAIPTTAGTGSESTHIAVCYVKGHKTSVHHDSLMPDAVILDSTLLASLPAYQRSATFMDALCQAIESHWSVGSTDRSRKISSEAISILNGCAQEYLSGGKSAASDAIRGSNLAGKSINLTMTTAAHAMSYGLTSHMRISHGHAVALCMPYVWEILLARGNEAVQERLTEISEVLGTSTKADGLKRFRALFTLSGLEDSVAGTQGDIDTLTSGVDASRLGNYPVKLTIDDLGGIYAKIIQ